MGSKRANGEASIRFRKDRNRWYARWTMGFDEEGQQRRRSVSAPTRKEAVDRMNAIRGSDHEQLDVESTLKAFTLDWLDGQRSRLAESTHGQYTTMMRNYIWPDLGSTQVGALAPRDIEKWMQGLLDRGLSPATVRQARSVLRRALRYAVRDGLIRFNPATAEYVDGVRQDHKEGRTMTLLEVDKLRAYIDEYRGTGLTRGYDMYGLLCTFLLGTGLRKGEALALKWGDFEGWMNNVPTKVQVQRSLKKRASGQTYVSSPKTGTSRRTVILPDFIASMMAPWRRGDDWLVFSTKFLKHLDPDKVNREIQKLTDEAGIGRWTPHELRHTAASLMLHAGVPLTTVSRQLGHSSIRVTADVYGHLMVEDRQQVADALGGLLRPPTPGGTA